jgi:hypothetical protein
MKSEASSKMLNRQRYILFTQLEIYKILKVLKSTTLSNWDLFDLYLQSIQQDKRR